MKKSYALQGFFFLLLSAIFIEILLNLTPPISRDAVIHHLAIPKLWIEQGGFYETPWADFSYYPMYVNLFYLVPLIFKNDILPKFIHMLFGFGTGWLIFSYLKRKYDPVWGMLGFVIFFTTPIIIWLSTSAYIDLGMTFFTTASILAFVQWRESEYKSARWLIFSGMVMGVAVGSKYNALMVWFIINLLIMVVYVRDTENQWAAVKYGFYFLLLTVIVASPWYIKNYILTDNPFYPLFNRFFQSLHSPSPVSELVKQGMEKSTQHKIGFFQMRAYMYGENFWETLAIPIRMFFQGDDNSYQYFQGKLNPILIVFLPFVFLSKTDRKNNLLFLAFSAIFMFMAFFLTEKQIRYQLPVFPFFSILAVVGIYNIAQVLKGKTGGKENDHQSNRNIRRILSGALVLIIGLLLLPNMAYLKERFDAIKPVPYLLGKESRDDFLRRHLQHYDAALFINGHLPPDATVFTIYFGRRGYYIDRSYFNFPDFGTGMLRKWVKSAETEEKFVQEMKAFKATHIAMRSDLVGQFLQNNFPAEEAGRLIARVQKHWKLLYDKENYAVWEIQKH